MSYIEATQTAFVPGWAKRPLAEWWSRRDEVADRVRHIFGIRWSFLSLAAQDPTVMDLLAMDPKAFSLMLPPADDTKRFLATELQDIKELLPPAQDERMTDLEINSLIVLVNECDPDDAQSLSDILGYVTGILGYESDPLATPAEN